MNAAPPIPAASTLPPRRPGVARIGREGRGAVVTERDREAFLADLAHRLGAGEGFSVATLNLDHLVKLDRDPAFREAYSAQTHVTADGKPVVWLAWLAGTPVELITGSGNTTEFPALAARQQVPVALVGARDEVLAAAEPGLRAAAPGLDIVYRHAPGQNFDPDGAEAEAIIAALAEHAPCLVLLALGAPRQERFAARALRRLPNTGFVCIGAGLDFVAGTQRRAPAWMRAIALEWLWRLLREPRRLGKRYLDCLLLLPSLTRAALSERRTNRRADP